MQRVELVISRSWKLHFLISSYYNGIIVLYSKYLLKKCCKCTICWKWGTTYPNSNDKSFFSFFFFFFFFAKPNFIPFLECRKDLKVCWCNEKIHQLSHFGKLRKRYFFILKLKWGKVLYQNRSPLLWTDAFSHGEYFCSFQRTLFTNAFL